MRLGGACLCLHLSAPMQMNGQTTAHHLRVSQLMQSCLPWQLRPETLRSGCYYCDHYVVRLVRCEMTLYACNTQILQCIIWLQ